MIGHIAQRPCCTGRNEENESYGTDVEEGEEIDLVEVAEFENFREETERTYFQVEITTVSSPQKYEKYKLIFFEKRLWRNSVSSIYERSFTFETKAEIHQVEEPYGCERSNHHVSTFYTTHSELECSYTELENMKNILHFGNYTVQSATVDCVPINSQLQEYIAIFLKTKRNLWYNGGYSLVQTAEILIMKPRTSKAYNITKRKNRTLTHKIASTSSVQPYSSFLNVNRLRNCSSFTFSNISKIFIYSSIIFILFYILASFINYLIS
ncbi:uncharacterized protein LOC143236105 [Tachypleus tridentatus]|uniref:uncharacterized protein LOC143236105 n=1 Tax=Tachypleus tridentatus TaxID=6853 RepID=UPI003FD0B2B0